MQTRATQSDEEFLARFGDVIDDRVAEAVDEMLGQDTVPRRRAWLRPVLAAAALGGPARLRPTALRRARLAALAVGGFLLPWCVFLSAMLPATARAQNWSLAWAGLDGAEALAALATAVLIARTGTWAALTAAAGGTLLLVDAWFDVCTSAPGLDHALAIAEAVFIELPLAAAAGWLAVRLTRGTR